MANLLLIKELCEKNNITFSELCRRIGRDESGMHASIRRGSTKVATIEEIARVLGVTAGYFFDGYAPEHDVNTYLKEIRRLEELVSEKERTIQILLEERKRYCEKK